LTIWGCCPFIYQKAKRKKKRGQDTGKRKTENGVLKTSEKKGGLGKKPLKRVPKNHQKSREFKHSAKNNGKASVRDRKPSKT